MSSVAELVTVGQEVKAYVISVDADKKKVGLSLKEVRPAAPIACGTGSTAVVTPLLHFACN